MLQGKMPELVVIKNAYHIIFIVVVSIIIICSVAYRKNFEYRGIPQ